MLDWKVFGKEGVGWSSAFSKFQHPHFNRIVLSRTFVAHSEEITSFAFPNVYFPIKIGQSEQSYLPSPAHI